METLVLSRPLTRNGSVGNPCGLHRGQWVWHNSSSCVDRGTVALFLGGLVVAAWIIELKTILAATQFEERQRVAEDATESEKKGAAP